MTFCSNCGTEVKENQKFCPECGAILPAGKHSESSSTISENENITTPRPMLAKENQGETDSKKQGILGRVDLDKEDIDEIAEKARKRFGAAWMFARKGVKKGAELASQGIDAAKESIEDRRNRHDISQDVKFCSNCGNQVALGKFCNNCGHKLE